MNIATQVRPDFLLPTTQPLFLGARLDRQPAEGLLSREVLLLHSGVLLLHGGALLLHSVVLLPLLRRSGVLLFLLLNNPVLTTSQMKQEAKPIITTLLRPLQ